MIGFHSILFVAVNAKSLGLKRVRLTSTKDSSAKVKFADVAGMTEAKHEIMEFVHFLKDPRKYRSLGAQIPRGALLVGPPGTGKTLLAKATAGEAGVPFFSISGSEFVEEFVGVGASRVRELFKQAKKESPSIIFIDEIDSVGRKRTSNRQRGGGSDEQESTLNQLLVEMDGFDGCVGVVVLAGTNRSDILDPALTRPGRFDRTVTIERPDLSERAAIFEIHMKPLKLDSALNPRESYKRLAALTPGFVGADIRSICNEAAIYAARRNACEVSLQDFENACERVMGGVKKTTGFLNNHVRRIIAYHEAGHAVVGWFLQHADPVLKVSIIPRTNGALGFAQNLPEETQILSRDQVLDRIAVLLGGRISEELNIGEMSSGASDDFQKATGYAFASIKEWGFSSKVGKAQMPSLGNIHLQVGLLSFSPQEDEQLYKPFSEKLAQLMEEEAREIIQGQYHRAKKLLQEKSLEEILGERPHPFKEEYAQYIRASPEKTRHSAELTNL
ncbi:AFG3-like protein 1 [Condylostylus longicornis]|uniref:AFG3-like protein 1 n=1 Tax=Condylostylus longicornis TaxID=2530218 RepID=UPI00244D9E6C|nr:AFG3-like protein 1 [Condylostylus longicornis]